MDSRSSALAKMLLNFVAWNSRNRRLRKPFVVGRAFMPQQTGEEKARAPVNTVGEDRRRGGRRGGGGGGGRGGGGGGRGGGGGGRGGGRAPAPTAPAAEGTQAPPASAPEAPAGDAGAKQGGGEG